MEAEKAAVSQLEMQTALLKKQLVWTRIVAILCAAVLIAAAICLMVWGARINRTLDACERAANELEATAAQLSGIAAKLSGVDWQSLTENVNAVAQDAHTAIGKAIETVEGLDIDMLNKGIEMLNSAIETLDPAIQSLGPAIEDLKKIVEPLAKFMERFR